MKYDKIRFHFHKKFHLVPAALYDLMFHKKSKHLWNEMPKELDIPFKTEISYLDFNWKQYLYCWIF